MKPLSFRTPITRVVKALMSLGLRLLPVPLFFRAGRVLTDLKLAQMSDRERMKVLLEADNTLHNRLAHAGVELGAGAHVKHDLMQYHEFFTDHISGDDIVFDVGCGVGEVAAIIARKTKARVIAVDFDKDRLDKARSRCAGLNVECILGDATKADIPTAVTVIVLSNVLEHIEARPEFVHRLFKSSGAKRMLVRVPVFERHWTVPLKKKMGVEWRLDTTHFTEFTVPQFEAEMAEAGCRVLSLQQRWCEIWAVVEPADV